MTILNRNYKITPPTVFAAVAVGLALTAVLAFPSRETDGGDSLYELQKAVSNCHFRDLSSDGPALMEACRILGLRLEKLQKQRSKQRELQENETIKRLAK